MAPLLAEERIDQCAFPSEQGKDRKPPYNPTRKPAYFDVETYTDDTVTHKPWDDMKGKPDFPSIRNIRQSKQWSANFNSRDKWKTLAIALQDNGGNIPVLVYGFDDKTGNNQRQNCVNVTITSSTKEPGKL